MKMLKRIVDSGVLGKIYYIQTGGGRRRGIPTPFGTTFIEKETGGIGALGDIGCYSLDMVLNAIGYPKPLTVTGYKSEFFDEVPEEKQEAFILKLMPLVGNVFSVYDLSDDNFALSSDYDLLYTELTGATVLYIGEYGV